MALSSAALVGDKPMVSTPYEAWGYTPVLQRNVAFLLILTNRLTLSALSFAPLILLSRVLVLLRTPTAVSMPRSLEAYEVCANTLLRLSITRR